MVVRIGLDRILRVYLAETLVARHLLRSFQDGWGTTPEHHDALWQSTLQGERRSLEAYEEAAQWS
ncbi:MAG: hypothetical protein MUO67_10305 [Anaerolineales bacterium]|nr:hypothetical protein [Anaerolineales bacterium]